MEIPLLSNVELPSWEQEPAPRASSSAKNVVFISIDDLNDWIGALGGYIDVQTPNLDRLAAQGMVFENAHTSVPVCNAARTAALTGLHPDTTGIFDNQQDWREVIADGETLPEYFRENGYQAVGTGKLFHIHKNSAFDEYFNGSDVRLSRVQKGRFGAAAIDVPDDQYRDVKNANFAVDWLHENQNSDPFFLGVGFNRPHLPLTAPQEFFDLYPLDSIQLPNEANVNDLDDVPSVAQQLAGQLHRNIVEQGEWAESVQAYLANISFVDAQVGKVLDAIDSSGHQDDTIVMLWSDHGWHLGEKLHWQKRTLWEEATRVPLIISAPGVTEAGSSTNAPVSLVDLFPTLTDLTGIPEKSADGNSLLPLLEDPNHDWDNPAITTWDDHYAVRTEDWRYIRYSDGTEELYDHRSDPNEFTNLADLAEAQADKTRLSGLLDDYFFEFAPERLPESSRPVPSDQVLLGDRNHNVLRGGQGDDQLFGRAGQDSLFGGRGHDYLQGGNGDDTLSGGKGNDTLHGGSGNDTLLGSAGDDHIDGGIGLDRLILRSTDSFISITNQETQGAGLDQTSNIEAAVLEGHSNSNLIDASGFDGNVTLRGQAGDDELIPSNGSSRLVGGKGADIFHITHAQGDNQAPSLQLIDFNQQQGDIISINAEILSAEFVAGQAITSEQLTLDSQASESHAQLIYNSRNGQLLFDRDGAGSESALILAKLNLSSTITAETIQIV